MSGGLERGPEHGVAHGVERGPQHAVAARAEGARRGRPGHDQASVLRVAIDLFNKQGYDATSVSDLARELGLTKSAIYHHVPSKEHLLERALDEALGELSSALDAVRDEASYGPAERLRAAVHASVVVLAGHLPAVTLLLRVRGNTPIEQAALARRRDIDQQLAGMVREAADAGAIRDDLDPLVISRLIFGMVNSLAEWLRADGEVEGLADTVATLAFDGLRHGTLRS